jgi:hypothetical protein
MNRAEMGDGEDGVVLEGWEKNEVVEGSKGPGVLGRSCAEK